MSRIAFVLALTLAACGGGGGPSQTPYQKSLDEATRACLREAKCTGKDVTSTLTTCIASYTTLAARYGRQGDVLSCVTSAGADCAKLLACLNDGQPAADCTEPFQATCDELANPPVYHGCTNGKEFAVICQPGTTCGAIGGPLWPCGIAQCQTGSTPPTCDTNGDLDMCEATLFVPSPCPEGLTCSGNACVGTGGMCNTTGGIRCDGNNLVFCTDHQQATIDCAASGHVCGTVAGQPACTTGAAETACTGAGLTSMCNGSVLTLCDDGNAYRYTCGQDGMACCGVGF